MKGSSYVASVLGGGCQAQVGLSIVKAVVVYVVDEHMVGWIHYLAVHGNGSGLSFAFGVKVSLGIKGAGVL